MGLVFSNLLLKHQRGFRLALADGSRWWITGLGSVALWVKKLAAIMELQPGKPDDLSRLIFFTRKDRDGILPPSAAANGWLCFEQPFLRSWYHSQFPDVFCELKEVAKDYESYVNLWNSLLFVHRGSVRRGGLPLHAALLAREGQAVVLAGRGGRGKSTCARRVSSPWRSLCDDEVLVVRTPDGHYAAHPFPTWSEFLYKRFGQTWKVEQAVSLRGLFFLEQSPTDMVAPLGGGEAAVGLFNSASQVGQRFFYHCAHVGEKQLFRMGLFDNACEIVQRLPAFRLYVSLNGRFWEQIEAALGWG